MPERINSPNPVRDLVKEDMYPTTMHGTRDTVTILDSRDRSFSAIGNDHRSLMAKLGDKVLDYLHKLAL